MPAPDIQAALGAIAATSDAAGAKATDAAATDGEAKKKGPLEDVDAISKRIDSIMSIERQGERAAFEMGWFRNILFYVGQQWIIKEKGRWRPKRLPEYYPRALTNKFAEKANDLVSTLLQGGMVPISYLPATDDSDDQATAEVMERVRDVFYREAKIQQKRALLASWMALTGNVFILPYYDDDEKFGMTTVDVPYCTACGGQTTQDDIDAADGACPLCGAEPPPPMPMPAAPATPAPGMDGMMPPAPDDATDPVLAAAALAAEQEGDAAPGAEVAPEPPPPLFEMRPTPFPIGAFSADVCSPFEIHLDHRIESHDDLRAFVRIRRYDLSFAKEKWHGIADHIAADGNESSSAYYLDALSRVTGDFGSGGISAAGGASASGKSAEKVTVYEIRELPSDDYPEGLMAVRVGKNALAVTDARPLPTKYGAGAAKGQPFLPLIHMGMDIVPGRYWRKTRMDDLYPLQTFRNVIEANIRLTTQRMGNSVWLEPRGTNVSVLSGEPGLRIQYSPVSLGGTTFAKPEREAPELSHIQALVMLINKIDDSMERVAGTFFLQGGDTPPGVTAASALAYLGEKAQRTMAPLMREWAEGFLQFEQYAIEIVRANWTDDRIRVVAGRNRKWQTDVFKHAELQGAVNMEVDYEKLMPKSHATTRAQVAQLVSMGVINPMDPEQQYQILKEFGMTEFKGSIDLDIQEAVKEQEAFLTTKGTAQAKVVPMVQNSLAHLVQHTNFAKTDEFKELPEPQQEAWLNHIAEHVADVMSRRAFMMRAGLSPDTPGLAEIASQQAQVAGDQWTQMMMQLGMAPPGGAPGAPPAGGPSAPGAKPAPGGAKPAAPAGPTPDIAGAGVPPGIQQPRNPETNHIDR